MVWILEYHLEFSISELTEPLFIFISLFFFRYIEESRIHPVSVTSSLLLEASIIVWTHVTSPERTADS